MSETDHIRWAQMSRDELVSFFHEEIKPTLEAYGYDAEETQPNTKRSKKLGSRAFDIRFENITIRRSRRFSKPKSAYRQ